MAAYALAVRENLSSASSGNPLAGGYQMANVKTGK